MRKLFTTFFLFYITAICQSQPTTKGKEFWLSYMENLTLGGNGQPQFSLQISADVNTSGTVSIPYTGYSMNYTVAANQTTEVYLPTNIYYPQGDETIFNFGIKVTALDSVKVYAFHHRLYFSESTIVLPVQELGDQYSVMAYKDIAGYGLSEFIAVATEDSTTVQITPSALTVGFRPPNIPFNVMLKKGQVVQIQSYNDLTGSIVKSLNSLKKIAVFSGTTRSIVSCSNADNHLFDQDYPIQNWGRAFIVVPFSGQGGDVFKILASSDSTKVTFIGGSTITLNAGQYYEDVLTIPTTISSTLPVAVAQFNKSQSCNQSLIGDPTMVMLSPINLNERLAVFKSVDGPAGNTWTPKHFVNVIVRSSLTGAVKLDNSSIASFFSPVKYNAAYSFCQLTLSAGNHILKSDSGFNALAYGFGAFNAYAFNTGYDLTCPNVVLSTAMPVIYNTVTVNCSGQCTGSVSASGTGGTMPYTYSWSPGGQSTQTISGLCANVYTLTLSDAIGTTSNVTVNIWQPSKLIIASKSSNPASCGTCTNGTATINPNGGTSPYTYSWSGIGQTTKTATGLSPGFYNVCITDAVGCTVCDSIEVKNNVGVDEKESGTLFQIIPNPFSSGTEIVFNKEVSDATLIVFNVLGDEVRKLVFSGNRVYLERCSLQSGVYFIEILSDQNRSIQRILVE